LSAKGAVGLFAAFDMRSGEVIGLCRPRKRQVEFIELLEKIDAETPTAITLIHIVCDNLSVHHGKKVRAWIERHPRFKMHFTPGDCSWMNQVEPWFSILRRKHLAVPNFADLAALEQAILSFIAEWNDLAHPFKWTVPGDPRSESSHKHVAQDEHRPPIADPLDGLGESAIHVDEGALGHALRNASHQMPCNTQAKRPCSVSTRPGARTMTSTRSRDS
jgi:hypothetical protein